MGLSKRESKARMDLYEIGYDYLTRNFHKFSQHQKIKISLEIIKKAMPQKLEHFDATKRYERFFQNAIRKSKEIAFVEEDSEARPQNPN